MRTRTKGQENKRMKRFRETGSMLVKKAKKKVAKKEVKKVAPKQDAPKKTPIKRKPSGRAEKTKEVKKSGGGRGRGSRLIDLKPVESSGGGARTGNNKKKRDVKLFGGTYTSRGNRRR